MDIIRGPTDVESFRILQDLFNDLRSWYLELADKLKIILIEASTNVLVMFSRELLRLLGDCGCERNLAQRNIVSV